jgi:hypothetical protein
MPHMEKLHKPVYLQIRLGTKLGLSWDTYLAIRHAAVDERMAVGQLVAQLLEEAWAARQHVQQATR